MRINQQLWFKSCDEISAEQTRLLQRHFNYCRRHSPYYQKTLHNFKSEPLNIQDLPATDKTTFAEKQADFIVNNIRGGTDICFTSGTTGTPCQILYSKNDLKRLAFNDAVGFMATGINADDCVLLTCTLDRCFIAGVAYYSAVQLLGASAIRNGLNTLESHAEIIKTIKPTVIVGVPSFLLRLGRFCLDASVSLNSVGRLICIGEPLRKEDLCSTKIADELQRIFECPAYSTYASSEIATSFTECFQRHGGHLVPELAIVEILDSTGNVLPPGEVGEVTVTPLGVTKMPLLRFRTGDLSFVIDAPCPCGRNTVRLGPILGRKDEMMKIRGTTLFPNSFFTAVQEISGIDEYYLERTVGADLSEDIAVFVASSQPVDLDKVITKIYAKTRIKVPVRIVSLEVARMKIYANRRKPSRFFTVERH
jgi:phenylacetate-CoA ligase